MQQPGRWMALVARTPADARDYNIEGPGGLLRNTPEPERPHYEPSKRRLTWPNDAWATIYSDDEPDQLRGFSGDTAVLDEFAKWKHPRDCWDNLQFGMREASGDQPRQLITTTPRPLAILREIEALVSTVVVTGSSYENRSNLDPKWFRDTIAAYEGTRFGRQEIHAEILDEAEGALWNRDLIEKTRVKEPPELVRVVVAIDPAVTSNADSDETGIVVAGLGRNKHGYVLDDVSGRFKPEGWAKQALQARTVWQADRLIGETNNGGEMVGYTLRTIGGPNLPYRAVTASRGKAARAEPVSALYEQGRVHHVGAHPELEDQLCGWEPLSGDRSPDRLDALVWAVTDLMLGRTGEPNIR